MSDKLAEVKAQSLFPDDLMAEISRSTLGRTLIVSLAVHALLIGVTSIGFIGLCVKYNSLHPKVAMAAEKKAQDLAAAQAGATADQPAGSGATATVPASGSDATPTANGEREKSPIERTVEEVDTNLPTGSSVGFGSVDSLD
jgi:hypothetical protein